MSPEGEIAITARTKYHGRLCAQASSTIQSGYPRQESGQSVFCGEIRLSDQLAIAWTMGWLHPEFRAPNLIL
jgi:hypothetical protein